MGILERIGLGPKKSEGIQGLGEGKKKEQEEAAVRKRFYIRWAIFLGFLALMIYALPQTMFRDVASYTVGEPWRADDLTAPFTFALQKTDAELEEERRQVRENTPPIFHRSETAHGETEDRIETLYRNLQPIFDRYLEWQIAALDPETDATEDSLRFEEELLRTDLGLDDDAWVALLENYVTVEMEGLPPGQFLGNRIRTELETLVDQFMNSGLIDLQKEDLPADEITIRDLRERTERNVSIQRVVDLEEAARIVEEHFHQEFDSTIAPIGVSKFNEVIRPNWVFSPNDTRNRLNEALDEISTTRGAVAQGEVIVRRGDIVTEEVANKLRSLAEVRADTATRVERWMRFSGELIILILTSLFFLAYLYLYRRNIFYDNAMFLLVFLVIGILVLASGLVYQFDNISAYIVPIAVAPLILTIIFDSRVGLLAAVTLAIITAVFNDNNFEYLIATVMACSFGVFSVRDINKRTQFFVTTPFVVFIGYIMIVGGFSLTRLGGWENFINQSMFIAINSVFILFTYPLILFFEKTFKITTDFTLLELADTNLPLLKEMMNKAPGTFHHSLQVANMAESAASAIGANALLCRVGALYHDIGKMKKPGYFIENQSGRNDHDKLKPRMSAMVIKAHVSDGVKMAEEHDLPETVINFIRTHHGTSLIKYFYDKALKHAGDEEIREEDFRYDGPLPDTRETGILLLADGIEAASRSMKNPTYNKLESLINRMVEVHISEGQMNHCPLTFHQIDVIKKTFLNILMGVYHSRVEYPEEEKAVKPDESSSDQKPSSSSTSEQAQSDDSVKGEGGMDRSKPGQNEDAEDEEKVSKTDQSGNEESGPEESEENRDDRN